MDKIVVAIGNVQFQWGLHVEEFFAPDTVDAEMTKSVDGSYIVWEQEVPFERRTLQSLDSGWITYDNKVLLVAMYKQLGLIVALHYSDGSQETVRFDHTQRIDFTPLWEGSNLYSATIKTIQAH